MAAGGKTGVSGAVKAVTSTYLFGVAVGADLVVASLGVVRQVRFGCR